MGSDDREVFNLDEAHPNSKRQVERVEVRNGGLACEAELKTRFREGRGAPFLPLEPQEVGL
jgi:hypothetical protein